MWKCSIKTTAVAVLSQKWPRKQSGGKPQPPPVLTHALIILGHPHSELSSSATVMIYNTLPRQYNYINVAHTGFHTGIFPGRGKYTCMQSIHVHVGAPARVLWILMKFWTCLRTRIVRFVLYIVIVLYSLS